MKTIEYSERGVAYSDHNAERIAREFLQGEDEYIHVSTANFIMATRALVYEGKFPHDQVEFRHEENRMVPDRRGRLREWPNGFCDHNDHWLMRLLDKPHWE